MGVWERERLNVTGFEESRGGLDVGFNFNI